MGQLDPLNATTRGLGEVIRAAIDSGATSIVIGLGGSASTDGGAGALAALGLRFLDEQGEIVADGGGSLSRIRAIDRTVFVPPPSGGVMMLTDVTAPLLGPTGAATVFGPQKGATREQVAMLDANLGHYSRLLGGDPGLPGTGAAGGTGYGFRAAWNAPIVEGADYLGELSGLRAAIASADVVISGEGRFDDQSLTGKVVGHVLTTAAGCGVQAGVIAGVVTTEVDVWTASLTELAGSTEAALNDPARWLRIAGALAATQLAPR